MEPAYQRKIRAAWGDYHDYLEREVVRKLQQISVHYPSEVVTFQSGMGTFFFSLRDNKDYLGFGAKAMIARLDAALYEFGWSVIPAGIYNVVNGQRIDV